jgi:hypothetical protein
MGLFKQMKQMKDSVSEAPDLVRSAMEMQEAMQAAPPPGSTVPSAPTDPAAGASEIDREMISNVSLARYAEICRIGTQRGITDAAGVAAVAVEHGISAADWDAGMNGWNARFASDTPAAMRFNALWRGIG